jgi:class 3 adenylate cyclase
MTSEFLNPSRYQELLEILAGQVHRDLVRQYPDELWQIRRQGLAFEDLTNAQKTHTLDAARENLEALLGAGIHIELPRTPERDLQQVRQDIETLLKQGEPIFAYDLSRRARLDFPEDVPLRQLQALSLIRTGAPGEALTVLTQLLREGHRDQGTLAPLARAYRDYGERMKDPGMLRKCFLRAFQLYDEAYRSSRGVWSGIHAAWLALELGFADTASELATQVELGAQDLLQRARADGADPFWYLAILGISAMLQSRFSEGFGYCQEMAEIGRGRIGDVAEVRYLNRSILELLHQDVTTLESILPAPKVLVFAGHMIDFPDRKTPRFPPSLAVTVARIIRERLSSLHVEAGFATAACGAPILFHEAVQALGGESHVVLPYGRDEFVADSVAIREDMDWTSRFDHVLEKARRVVLASPQRLDEGSVVFSYANQLLLGLGLIRAHQLRCELKTLVVWDGQPSEAAGSISRILAQWKELGHSPEIIDLRELESGIIDNPKHRRRARSVPALRDGLKPRVMVMLFADVVRFSQLQERQVPSFVAHFLGAIGALETELKVRPAMKNTWGDGLFMVFWKAQNAICFSRALVERVGHTDWASLGLPPDLNLRVALHTGPVYVGRDPVTRHRTCFGTHVNNAARIEPITPPGKIYVSQAFAALAAAMDLKDCPCEYVGEMPLAKNFGRFPMYVLQTMEDPVDLGDPSDQDGGGWRP